LVNFVLRISTDDLSLRQYDVSGLRD
jgi:hypothetical protein